MTRVSINGLLGFGAAITVALALSSGAQAACWWAGGDWNCTSPAPPGSVMAPPVSGPYYTPAPTWGFAPGLYQTPATAADGSRK